MLFVSRAGTYLLPAFWDADITCSVWSSVVRWQWITAADKGALRGVVVLKEHIARGIINPFHKSGPIVTEVGEAVCCAHAVHPI